MTGADLIALLKKHPLSVVCLVVALVCGVLIYLRGGNVDASQAELDAKTTEANKMIANVRNSTGLAEQVSQIEGHRKELEGRLMKLGQLAVNLQYFYKLEAETEVKLVDVRQNSLGRGNRAQYVGVPFSVSVQGTYPQVVNFLTRLQNGRHLCRIVSANFSKVGGVADAGPQMNLSLSVELLGQQ